MDLAQLDATPAWEWPDDAAQTILAVLKDPAADTEQRMLAAYLGGDVTVVDDTMAAALLAVVDDPAAEEPLRAQAAIALGPALEHADLTGFDHAEESLIGEDLFVRIQRGLRRICEDEASPKEVRRRALEASVRAPQDWHPAVVGQGYASGDPEWRLTAVFGMQYVEGFDDQILEVLSDPDPEIRYEAVCAAGARELDGAWEAVVRIVGDPDADKELRIAAIEAVVGIRPEAAEEVLGPLVGNADDDIDEAANEALAMAEAILEMPDDDCPDPD